MHPGALRGLARGEPRAAASELGGVEEGEQGAVECRASAVERKEEGVSKLIRYEQARHALAACKQVDEVKDWADKAAAMQAYGRMAKDKALEVDAAEIRIRAERRLGELIAAQKAGPGLNAGAKGIGKSAVPQENRTPTLADMGIDKKQSARAQNIAAVPEAEFEQEIGEWRERVTAEGARVSARLDAKGAKERGASVPEADADEDSILDSMRRRISQLNEQVEALSKDDLAAEVRKQMDLRIAIEQRLDDTMATNVRLNADLRAFGKWQMDLFRATGVETRAEVLRIVRTMREAA